MIRWDYKLVAIGGSASASPRLRLLAAAGEDGWEAVALEHGHVLCKRPRPVEIEMTFAYMPPGTAIPLGDDR